MKKTEFTCRYCSKAGVPKEENTFKTLTAVRAHERARHKKKVSRRRNGVASRMQKASGDVIVQETINYCCYCGKQLPNATIVR